MRRHRASPFAVLLLVTVSVGWASARAQTVAQTVNEDGAKAVAATLTEGLKRWTRPQDGTKVTWKGAVQVKPAGDHYAVTIPDLKVENVEGSGMGVRIGDVALTMAPRDGGLYAVTATLPDSMPLLDEGKTQATIRLGRQRFSGIWSGSFETLLSMDAEYGDLSVTGSKTEGSLRIGTVTAMSDLKPDGPATWSGPGALAVSKLSFLDEKKREVLAIDGLTMEGNYSRINLERMHAMQALLQGYSLAGAEPPPAEALAAMRDLMGGGSFRMRLSGLSAIDTDSDTRLGLGLLTANGGIEDLDRPLATLSFGMEAGGFTMTPSMAPSGFEPQKLLFQVSLAKLPSAALWQAFSDMAAVAGEEEGAGKGRKIAATPDPALQEAEIGQRLLAALSDAGTELRVDKAAIDAPALSGSMTGMIRAVSTAAQGATGDATILLRGLDSAARSLQPSNGKAPDEETQSLLGMLAMLQAMGQAGKDAAGNDLRTYQIGLTEDGRFLLNGADMTPMLSGGGEEEELSAPDEEEEYEEEPMQKKKKH